MHILHTGIDQRTLELLTAARITCSLVEDVEDSEDLLSWARDGAYEGIVVDLEASGLGTMFPRVFRKQKVNIPLIGLISRNRESLFVEEKATFLEYGGDDLLESPPNPRLLIATIRSCARRYSGSTADVLSFTLGDVSLKVDRTCHTVTLNGTQMHLTAQEYKLLESFAKGNGRTQSKEMLLNALYGGRDEPEMKIIDVFVCKLRNKLKDIHPDAGEFVETVWGRGYRLKSNAMPPETAAAHTVAA